MNTQPDNPPAFPNTCPWPPTTAPEAFPHYGMTLRDWFAGQAPEMPSWFQANRTESKETVPWPEKGPGWVREQMVTRHEPAIDHLARWRYHYADAMLRAREGKQ